MSRPNNSMPQQHGQRSELMIPSVLAAETKKALGDYLRTTFLCTTPTFKDTLNQLLASDRLFKGPFLTLHLPFVMGTRTTDWFPAIPFPFRPYKHQELAFERLTGDTPQPTIIATGTGSGKTEAFLLPILEHCRKHAGQKGIKAILIYPMNALATDQSRRIARLIHKTNSLKGKVRAGLFIGSRDKEPQGIMSEDSIITSRDMMRHHPPDILLTNYKMLDLLMVRARDASIWSGNRPGTLRFLVVDELHTFDGAQGTDLACLLRRLKARLQAPDVCPIGTSATLGVSDEATDDLHTYARSIFDREFGPGSIIREQRVTAGQFLQDELIGSTDVPADLAPGGHLDPDQYTSPSAFVAAQFAQWFPNEAKPTTDRVMEPQWRSQLGQHLMKHLAFRNLLTILKGKTLSVEEVARRLAATSRETADAQEDDKTRVLDSLLALTSVARRPDRDGSEPLVDIRLDVWIREMRRMVASVGPEADLTWADDVVDQRDEDSTTHLPMVLCRNCGTAAWGGLKRQNDHKIHADTHRFYNTYFNGLPDLCLLFPGPQESWADHKRGKVQYLCSLCLSLHRKQRSCSCGNEDDLICVYVPDLIQTTNGRAKARPECPTCDSRYGISIVGAQASSVSAVIASQMFASQYNGDKKLLAFSDSVQDASHRAGFFQGRTFQFTVRSALAQYLNRSANRTPTLEATADGFRQSLRGTYPDEAFVGTFIAPDLLAHHDYDSLEEDGQLSPGSELPGLVADRLHWEVYKAFGHWARIGRSLEKVLVAAAAPCPALLRKAREAILEPLRNETGGLSSLTERAVDQFLAGFLYHLRVGGGIYHPALKGYIQSMGDARRMSSPKVAYMPRAGRRTPAFATDGKSERFRRLLRGKQRTWLGAWATKSLAGDCTVTALGHAEMQFIVNQLVDERMLECHDVKGKHVWSIPGNALLVSTDVYRYHCITCGHEITSVHWERTLWDNAPCMAFTCSGAYERAKVHTTDYYKGFYQTADVTRIVAREHTGILTRQAREELEKRFMGGKAEWDPNIISCTPTLELGIDIGDLSSLILCFVPPTSSNYFQRTGRAGRRDGNAVTYTLANARPHDLYFFEDPQEMIAGGVVPPGTFLDAPAVLERQLAAYSMDRWVGTGIEAKAVPARLKNILRKSAFPDNWVAYVRLHRQSILDGFLALFQDDLSEESRDHLTEFLTEKGLPHRLQTALERVKAEISALIKRRAAVRRRRKHIDSKPKDLNYDRETFDLNEEKHCIGSRIRDIKNTYVHNFLTNEGLLPNYAFPEAGVTLQSEVYSRSKDKNSKINPYQHPAAAAIKELAPGNFFYTEGRKIEISRLDLNSSEHEPWRFCDQCAYAEQAAVTDSTSCPKCNSPGWSDVGQQVSMRKLQQVCSTSDDRQSRSFDETELRRKSFYVDRMLVSFEPREVLKAFGLEDEVVPFGCEYISSATFRHINFGMPQGAEQSLIIAGHEVNGSGFLYCPTCGATKNRKGSILHTYSCTNRVSNAKPLSSTYLYRELQTETIRMLLPFTSEGGSGKELASFVAGLQLGIRKYFGGAVDHLKVTEQDEPIEGISLRRHYVFLYDTVPGGTGYLKDLMKAPRAFIEILKRASQAMVGCRCTVPREEAGLNGDLVDTGSDDSEHVQVGSERDGCYRCLLAYRNSWSHQRISRETALSLFSKIIDREHSLRKIRGLDEVNLNKLLDSALEQKFVALLKDWVQQHNGEFRSAVVRGKDGYAFALNDNLFEIEPQASLGLEDNIQIPSSADFVIWPSDHDVWPVAVFADGFKFHKDRLGLDTAQRTALVRSDKCVVWSLTWKDVLQNTDSSHYSDFVPLNHSRPASSRFIRIANASTAQFGELSTAKDPVPSSMEMLFQYLQNPRKGEWQARAYLHAVTNHATVDRAQWEKNFDERAPHFLPGEYSGGSDDIIGIYPSIKGRSACPVSVMVRTSLAGFSSFDIKTIQCLLYLDDSADAQAAEGFQKDWNGFLRAMNLYQFLPTSFFVAQSGLDDHAYDELEPPKEDGFIDWLDVQDMVDPEGKELLNQIAGPATPVPEIAYELVNDSHVVIAQAEIAWPAKRLALLASHENESWNREEFASEGWTVQLLQETEAADLIAHLTEAGA